MIPRLLPDDQLELFPETRLYVSQGDAARVLGISARMIQYWESHELLHPETPQEGRSRRYTSRDLVELAFIKGMVVDQGYSIPSLKEKLASLPAPYYYDPRELFWDLRDGCWRSRGELAAERMAALREPLSAAVLRFLEARLPLHEDLSREVRALLGVIRDTLSGRLQAQPAGGGRGGRARRSRAQPSGALLSSEAASSESESRAEAKGRRAPSRPPSSRPP